MIIVLYLEYCIIDTDLCIFKIFQLEKWTLKYFLWNSNRLQYLNKFLVAK